MLVSGMILNNPLINDLWYIRRRKQQLIDKDNWNKNENRKPHTYRLRDKVPVHNKKKTNMSIHTKAATLLPRCGQMEIVPYIGVL